jgi:CHAT domain-containing protein
MEALGGGALLLSHDSELIEVPWELALAAGQPWCERVALGRQVILGDLSQRRRVVRADHRYRMVIIADPRVDLPEARAEAEAFLGSLELYRTFLDADFLGASRATLPSVLRALDGADFVYYVGHGVYDPGCPEASGWLLSDGVLGPERLRNLEAPPRFVFSNACNSAEDIPQEKSRMGRAANAGMVSGLVMAGVEACIGARWPIRAESGSALALAFFHRALGGASLGEALREARQRVRRTYGEDDLAWASFVLYGNPVQRLVPVAPGAVCK